MKAVGVFPGRREVKLVEIAEPGIVRPDDVLVRMIEVGVCGTDRDLCRFVYGIPPEGEEYFVLGHESLAEVVAAGSAVQGLRKGDLVVGTVRLPCDDAACAACRSGNQDFCASGGYRERGIKGIHGFMTEMVVEAERNLFAVPAAMREIAVLVEPLTIAEKAYAQAMRVSDRLPWAKERAKALVLGAGAVGLLGAMKLVLEGHETFVYSREGSESSRARLVEAIGARYVSSACVNAAELREEMGRIDLVYEALGAAQPAFDVLSELGPNGVFVFTGVPRSCAMPTVELGTVMWNLILRNQLILGTVNAGRGAYEAAVRDLGESVARWPEAVRGLITGRWTMEEFAEPLQRAEEGIKSVVRMGRSDLH